MSELVSAPPVTPRAMDLKTLSMFALPLLLLAAVIVLFVATPASPAGTLLSFTLIGLYVGVIPVFLGLFWYPALRRLGHRAVMFLMALTAGLLVYLGIAATSEALELARAVGGPFQGVGLV